MKLENQVCSLELAKKLKELGVKQDSLFKWHSKLDEKGNRVHTEIVYLPIKQMEQDYSAFTVAELGEMLPNSIDKFVMVIMKMNKGTWVCGYYKDLKEMFYEVGDKILVTAMAKMLIWLIENKMMEVGGDKN